MILKTRKFEKQDLILFIYRIFLKKECNKKKPRRLTDFLKRSKMCAANGAGKLCGAERLEVNAVGVRARVQGAGDYALNANAERKGKQIK